MTRVWGGRGWGGAEIYMGANGKRYIIPAMTFDDVLRLLLVVGTIVGVYVRLVIADSNIRSDIATMNSAITTSSKRIDDHSVAMKELSAHVWDLDRKIYINHIADSLIAIQGRRNKRWP